ncbi:MAG TPA: diguanylate cyclase, partial [Telluria sp.]
GWIGVDLFFALSGYLIGNQIFAAMRRVEGWRLKLADDGARIGQAAVNATFSAGVCGYPEHGHDTETLIACADKALYRSKHEGRNRVVVFEPD